MARPSRLIAKRNPIENLKGKHAGGRPKGSPNKIPALLKDALLEAAMRAGDGEGMVGYLEKQARENPNSFLTILGKVLPLQVGGIGGEAIEVNITIGGNAG